MKHLTILITTILASFLITHAQKTSDIDFIYIEGGYYIQGKTDSQEGKYLPSRKVYLDDFYIATKEVPISLYSIFCQEQAWPMPIDIDESKQNHPISNISWYDAVSFCNWLSQKHNLQACYTIDPNKQDPNNTAWWDDQKWFVQCNFNANGYRLPTEAEWEYVATLKGTHTNDLPAGVSTLDSLPYYTNFCDTLCQYHSQNLPLNDGHPTTAPIGSLLPNPLGIYDLSGNVWEWCWDWYQENPAKQKRKNPTGPKQGGHRVARGGGWDSPTSILSPHQRINHSPNSSWGSCGFRLVKSP